MASLQHGVTVRSAPRGRQALLEKDPWLVVAKYNQGGIAFYLTNDSGLIKSGIYLSFPCDRKLDTAVPVPALQEGTMTASIRHQILCILGHVGPLKKGCVGYLNSSYNLSVQWSDGSRGIVPLKTMLADCPDSLHEYASLNNMLNLPGWKRGR